MTNLRRWQIDPTSPFSLQIAADARLSKTDYTDDQVWELQLGDGESPALALQTRYGGRAGLASIIPMWLHDGRVIYQTQTYAKPPYVTAFAPGYIRVQATLTPQLALQAEYWVMESHAIGARLTLANGHTVPTDVRLDLLGFVGIGGKEQKLHLLSTSDSSNVLSLGKVGNLLPIIVLESATPPIDFNSGSNKIGRDVTIEGRKKVVFRWVQAALPNVDQSIGLARTWLEQDWDIAFQQISQGSEAIPEIATGNADWDAAIAFSHQQLVQAFLKPTTSLPYASFVSLRQPERGFNPSPENNHDRNWSGQTPTHAYPIALAIASVNPTLAEGIVRNYLAVQQPDGWIDWKPGLGGQKQGILCLPILARMAWGIFQYTEDTTFLRETYTGLLKSVERWLQPDFDADDDGAPEWQSENQTGYVFYPSFATWQGWGQGADIQLVESPDLISYLLSETKSLREIAYHLRNETAEQRLTEQISSLQKTLDGFWNTQKNRFVYRDRDTHVTAEGVVIVQDARGGDELILAEKLEPANRLIIYVTGGVDLIPRFTMRLLGFNRDGLEAQEEVNSDRFVWSHGRGVYTSRMIFSQIDTVTFDGLSRVYRVDIQTVDTSHLDINMLLPLWSPGLPPEQVSAISALITDTNHFWRPNGVTMCSASEKNFDPSNANGSGGIWPYWLTLIGEGLIEYGATQSAYALLKNLLNVQAIVLKEQKAFSEFYHSDEPRGLGERGHISGIVPLHLLMRVIGVRIINSAKVWVSGTFVWEQPISIKQHGVLVQRTSESTTVEFPSGHHINVVIKSDVDWQEIIDTTASTIQPTLSNLNDVEEKFD